MSSWSRRDFIRNGSIAGAAVMLGSIPGCRYVRTPEDSGVDMREKTGPMDSLDALIPVFREIVEDLEKTVPYAAVLALRMGGHSVRVDDRSQDLSETWPSQGVVISAYNGAWIEEVAVGRLEPETLRSEAKSLKDRLKLRQGGPEIDPGSAMQQRFATMSSQNPLEMPLADQFQWVVDLHNRARMLGGDMANTTASYSMRTEEGVFVNRSRALHQLIIRVSGSVSYVARNEERTVRDWLRRGGRGGLELVQFGDEQLEELAAQTRLLLEAERVEPGSQTLVVDGGVAGTLAHESFGHGVELDMFVKDRALAEEYLGKRVASPLVDIVDDPSLEDGYGGYYFDHEGAISSPTDIVRDGVFRRGLSDLMSSATLGAERTANGRRQDFSRKVYARMSNTFFAPGDSSVDELIAGVDRGLYLRKWSHGMEDPKGWGIQVGAHIGHEIRAGQLTGKIYSPVGITGYVPDVLNSIDGVANDFSMSTGGCGKGFKEFVPVGSGGPHLRLTARVA